eukprot:TRINITY_DN43652_c0_g1_i1.p1 TRINITY_DN43652_c0_g1~~TRINITY_DN43652_c0_g1_i1.p1  ORF type:complete len:319 (-),score=62.32 TRINITY_DN43652_c0_g1_i1:398-1354(-)
MADYYSILGVSKTANDIEIKAAFRRLAKIYHPDKNPNNPDAKQLFESVLKAYNTLIHPSSRRRYDQRVGDQTHITKAQHNKRKTQKEWSFAEEEMQRRQYYEKYYKAKQQERAKQQAPPPKAHSDYKYVLFATPIAVGLLMLIISMFTKTPDTVPLPPKKEVPKTEEKLPEPVVIPEGQLATGKTPYSGYFGGVRTYSSSNSLTFQNPGDDDAVVVVFDKESGAYLQHAYLQASYSITFEKLPATGIYWKCMIGRHWNENKLMAEKTAIGAFDTIVQFQNRKKAPVLFGDTNRKTVDIVPLKTGSKTYMGSEADFFAR